MSKFTSAISIALTLCGSAFAGTMGAVCEKGNLSTPCANNAWEIGGQALYLKTAYTGEFSSLADTSTSSWIYSDR